MSKKERTEVSDKKLVQIVHYLLVQKQMIQEKLRIATESKIVSLNNKEIKTIDSLLDEIRMIERNRVFKRAREIRRNRITQV